VRFREAVRLRSSMPAFEELSDDAADKPTRNAFGSRVEAPVKATTNASGSIRRGFLDGGKEGKKAPRPAAAEEKAVKRSLGEPLESTAVGSSDGGAANAFSPPPTAVATEAGPGGAIGCGADALSAADFSHGLRKRLQNAVEHATASRRASQSSRSAQNGEAASAATTDAVEAIAAALASSKAELGRWPTSSSRDAREKATTEAGAALAELRGVANDARRLRSTGGGDTCKTVGDLKRATDEATERVRKAVEAVVPKDFCEEDASSRVVTAFHSLPFSAKLRMLADERVAISAVVCSFTAGAAVMFGILAEVYTAWGCAFQCQR